MRRRGHHPNLPLRLRDSRCLPAPFGRSLLRQQDRLGVRLAP